MAYDLVIRNGTVVTAADSFRADVGIAAGRVAALGEGLAADPSTGREIEAAGKLVLPGGIDSHLHIEQLSGMGLMNADDFHSGTISAAFGGNTTIIPFAAQHHGQSLRDVVKDYHARAAEKAVIDYAFHLIISDPTEQVLGQELPALIADGYTSFKVYTTYDMLRLDDYQMLEVLALARREGALVMVHAENHEVIRWLGERLLEGGYRAPKYHAVAHARLAEKEATHRVIALAELLDVPLLVVHVSTAEAAAEIRRAQDRGLKIYGETCPQYLFLTAADLDRPGAEGAMFCCSPPPRDAAAQEAMWQALANDTFQVFSSDHAPYRFDESGKLAHGPDPDFKHVANGVPGVEVRLPLLFSEGVGKGRIDLNRFVALAATNAARLYGLYPKKGTIAVGSDADIAIWDPEREVEIGSAMLHDNVGYTPYEGRRVRGWPETVIRRGQVIVEDGELGAERGSGEFQPCASAAAARPLGRPVPELDPERNFAAHIQPRESPS
ncbi:MAG TPA: dihydropyrimidinase [Alphaproteobacteria bacterium]|jgi:dihydropyrimidinase|nr:dihydropyrimidinase [Alphaproteobacteria bacterium]MDP6268901.1 dihydropyrimidinase [Alphaproteobacteria bacterium]MDP7164078.1 dihydropyrimidinase [Alphaproteobacteria bacterium]MDP7427509.1 dihydropyrimidinase [Alphaproteobacteria bacterium]HJM49170.1 dihydropyrimidinase [Alphaproteobacteria bacterium]